MDWYCAEYKESTLYELHNGKTAVGLEDLDELLMRTIDPNLAAEQFGKPDSLTRRGWEEAPNKRFAFLEVEPVTINEKPAPFPQAFNVEPAIMGLAHAISQADNDLKATGRFHDASLAEPGPEQSGKAIIARQRQDELSNGGFIAGHLIGLASVCRQLTLQNWRDENPPETTGWSPTCEHKATTVPAEVLDCFGGSGTVALVAERLQRNAILIEISPTYAPMAADRVRDDMPLLAQVTVESP